MTSYYDDDDRYDRRGRSPRTSRSARNVKRTAAPRTKKASANMIRKTKSGGRTTNSRSISPMSKKQKEKLQVKKQVLLTGGIFAALFFFMIMSTVLYAANNERTLFENDYNGREEILLSRNTRGRIYAADGQVLAENVEDSEGNQHRVYPKGNLFSHIVGYLPKGGSGLELQYDYQLVHSDISLSEKAAFDEKGELYPGNEVYTTLDPKLQQAASDALGDYRGAVIVQEADTGKILAMVSKPDFDPGTVEEDWDSIIEDDAAAILVNRASQGLYAPGSTFKIFDTIEYLKEDINNNTDYQFNCNGGVTFTDPKSGEATIINCYHWEVHGLLGLKESFAESCNSSFSTIGTKLNRFLYNQTLSELYFKESLPYDLPSGVSTYVLDDDTSTREILQLAIGQGRTLMTPLHLNMITSAIAQGGTVYKPYLVNYVKTGTGTVLEENSPKAVKTVMTTEIASLMQEYMRETVTNGTATKLSTRPYNAAGKTGTAEFSQDNKTDSNAWFTGFAYDATHAKVAITVIVEGVSGSAGSFAVPAARSVLDAYFGYTPAAGEDNDENYIHVINDHNGDGIPDVSTASLTSSVVNERPENVVALNKDTDGDGIKDAIDFNNDGVIDAWDLDGDGVPESSVSREAAEAAAKKAEEERLQEEIRQEEEADKKAAEMLQGMENSNQGAAQNAGAAADSTVQNTGQSTETTDNTDLSEDEETRDKLEELPDLDLNAL